MKQSDRQIISVVAAVIVHEGLILAAKRKAEGPSGGMWEFPGGKVEPGELPRDALVREIREELGLHIEVGHELGTYVTALERLTVELKCFWCQLSGGTLEMNDHDEVMWCSSNELVALSWPLPDVPAVREVLKASFGSI